MKEKELLRQEKEVSIYCSRAGSNDCRWGSAVPPRGKAMKIFLSSPSKTTLGSANICNTFWRTILYPGAPQEPMTELANVGD